MSSRTPIAALTGLLAASLCRPGNGVEIQIQYTQNSAKPLCIDGSTIDADLLEFEDEDYEDWFGGDEAQSVDRPTVKWTISGSQAANYDWRIQPKRNFLGTASDPLLRLDVPYQARNGGREITVDETWEYSIIARGKQAGPCAGDMFKKDPQVKFKTGAGIGPSPFLPIASGVLGLLVGFLLAWFLRRQPAGP